MSDKEKIADKKSTICVVDIDDQGLSKYFFFVNTTSLVLIPIPYPINIFWFANEIHFIYVGISYQIYDINHH